MNDLTPQQWQDKLDRCRTPDEVEEIVAGRAFVNQVMGAVYTTEMRQAAARRMAEVTRQTRR